MVENPLSRLARVAIGSLDAPDPLAGMTGDGFPLRTSVCSINKAYVNSMICLYIAHCPVAFKSAIVDHKKVIKVFSDLLIDQKKTNGEAREQKLFSLCP